MNYHKISYVYDACLQQEQLSNRQITVSDIVPVLNDCHGTHGGCNCSCEGNKCDCSCDECGGVTHAEAAEIAADSPCPLPEPCGTLTFESCRSSTVKGDIHDLSIERLCDRPQFARVRCNVDVPVDILFTDRRCREFMGRSTITVAKDVLLCIPEESVIPFTLESLVSAVCVSGSYIGDRTFKITVCVSVVLKVLAEVDILVPTYGFCDIPPCEEFAESVCDEFFSLPLFPQSSCAFKDACDDDASDNVVATAARPSSSRRVSTCSSCGTTCASGGSICPRCGSAMTALS